MPVGARLANAWALCDVLGNVWELCQDWYGPYPAEGVTNPVGPPVGVFRVMRGGSWRNSPDLCRPTYRSSIARTEARGNVGFRVVLARALQPASP
jgi:formylglycine-generating enzyme required for sulfatase activity